MYKALSENIPQEGKNTNSKKPIISDGGISSTQPSLPDSVNPPQDQIDDDPGPLMRAWRSLDLLEEDWLKRIMSIEEGIEGINNSLEKQEIRVKLLDSRIKRRNTLRRNMFHLLRFLLSVGLGYFLGVSHPIPMILFLLAIVSYLGNFMAVF